MNSIQYLSSRVERVIAGPQNHTANDDSASSSSPTSSSSSSTAALRDLAGVDPAALQSPLSDTPLEDIPSSLHPAQNSSESSSTSSPPPSPSLSPPAPPRSWYSSMTPIVLLLRFFSYLYAVLASTLGVSGDDRSTPDSPWDSGLHPEPLYQRRILEEDESFPLTSQRHRSIDADDTSSGLTKEPHIHLNVANDDAAPSIYNNSYAGPATTRKYRTVRIRLAKKAAGSGSSTAISSSSSSSEGEDSSSLSDTPQSSYSSVPDSSSSSSPNISIKSPTSPGIHNSRATKYPRALPPPRPLIPRHPQPKTLILDLDETLIHSMSKGSPMSDGHMVEVRLDKQHAILYYVHKRPYCDEFLQKVSKWYNLVIFTASVQEYADPVIDWLEQNRKYFKGRYYRQHCSFRSGGYVKDISVVEADLSKVMIIDNSPISYLLHEDNAIAIEGWINDPSDLDLLHLIPFLNGMRYVTDVRSIISLRMGENAFAV